jgi:glycosyltransferase involved in cell wall biosynthesis
MRNTALQHRSAKLAYLTSVIPALSATFIYREILELERRGYAVHIYSIWKPELASLSAEALPMFGVTHYLQPIGFGPLLRSHCYYVLRRPVHYLTTLCKMLSPFHHRCKDRMRSLMHFGEGIVLARQMELDGVTHLHSHYASQPTSVARVVHLLTGIPYSFSAHAHDIWADRLLLREKLREVRFVACCSVCGQTELIKQGNPADAPKVHLIYHGVDVRRFIPPQGNERRADLILAVGRLEDVKGFHHLVEACQHLREQQVRFECRIVGEGDQRARLTALIDHFQLGEWVHLAGAVTQERLLAHYHEAALCTMPCVASADGRHDGIPNVFLEAMATALPVVTTPTGGIPELIVNGENGFLVPPASPKELAEKLKDLLRDASLRKSVGAAARETICARFDNRETIGPLIELFRNEASLEPCPAEASSNITVLGIQAERY